MLAIFKNGLVNPPKELSIPLSLQESIDQPKKHDPEVTLKEFLTSHQNNGFSFGFVDKALMAYVPSERSSKDPQRLLCGLDDIYCIFLGSLHNLTALNKQYGISKVSKESMFVIEAYRTLRDRGPYPAHQVLKDLEGSFGFVIYDHKSEIVFIARGADEKVKLFWGIAIDGSVMVSDSVDILTSTCAKSFAPFPTGCMYHSGQGLTSFEHPMNKINVMPRVENQRVMHGTNLKEPLNRRERSKRDDGGFSIVFVVIIGLIGLLVGYLINK